VTKVLAYDETRVPVAQSQEELKRLLLKNGASGMAFVSQPPMEGFQVQVLIEGKTYTIRVQCLARKMKNDEQQRQEERRIWRVLFFHMKAIFEAANSGLMEFRELILPYIVTRSGMTIAEHILPQLESAVQSNPERLLPSGKEK
jgi:hypothetical protein